MGRVRLDKKIFEAPRWYPSPMSIKDHVVLGLNEQVLIMYWRMQDLRGPVILVAFVTIWSNRNCYFMVVIEVRMRYPRTTATVGRSLWNQDFILSVEEQIQPRRDLVKHSHT
jgi:hypothetical protein